MTVARPGHPQAPTRSSRPAGAGGPSARPPTHLLEV